VRALDQAGDTVPATLIIPCAAPLRGSGKPTRPKWLLTTPQGRLLVTCATESVPGHRVGRIIVAFLRDVEESFGVTEALRRAFDRDVECLVLDEPTVGPAATVREVITRAGVTGPMYIKDPDSFFTLRDDLPGGSFLAVADICGMASVSEPGRKSYVRLNEQGLVAEIAEKTVISNLISVGLYGFADAGQFVTDYDRLLSMAPGTILYVSHVIANGLLHGRIFQPAEVGNLVDIGTRADWHAFRATTPTVVLDIDGVIFRNQSLFFPPYWGNPVEPIADNIQHLLSLQAGGAQLVFMTSRPEQFRTATKEALEALGLRVHALVMDCRHGTRYLVNDYAPTNPYPSAVAINTRRNTDDLRHVLLADYRLLDRDL
jgi:hypothetical protein